MKAAIHCKKLSKSFGTVQALHAIDLRLEEGKIYGLLGRNGAGKTTLLNIIAGQLEKTSGDVQLFGKNPYENAQVLSDVCFIKESVLYMRSFRVRQIFRIASDIFPNWDNALAHQLIQDFELDINKKIKQLSKGMESSVGIIIGLASRAKLTLFDEPYLGLDAAARNLFYDRLLEDYTAYPRTVVLSTHLIDEVSKLFEEVVILKKGEIELQTHTDNLRTNAHYVSGPAAKAAKWTSDFQIMHERTFNEKTVLALFGTLSTKVRAQMEQDGLEIEPMPLQQLMIHLTSDRDKEGVIRP